MNDIDRHLQNLQEHARIHFANIHFTRELARQNYDPACIICHPVRNDGHAEFYHFWNWYQQQTTAYQYSQQTVELFNTMNRSNDPAIWNIAVYRIVRSCRYYELPTELEPLQLGILQAFRRTNRFTIQPDFDIFAPTTSEEEIEEEDESEDLDEQEEEQEDSDEPVEEQESDDDRLTPLRIRVIDEDDNEIFVDNFEEVEDYPEEINHEADEELQHGQPTEIVEEINRRFNFDFHLDDNEDLDEDDPYMDIRIPLPFRNNEELADLPPYPNPLNRILPFVPPENLFNGRDSPPPQYQVENPMNQQQRLLKIVEYPDFSAGLQDPSTWLTEYQQACITNGATEAQKLSMVGSFLKKSAATWFRKRQNDANTRLDRWTTQDAAQIPHSFIHQFQLKFLSPDKVDGWRQELHRTIQKNGQTVEDYTAKMDELWQRVDTDGNYPEAEKISKFVQGLRKELRIQVQGQMPQTLDDAEKMATGYERAYSGEMPLAAYSLGKNEAFHNEKLTESFQAITEEIKGLKASIETQNNSRQNQPRQQFNQPRQQYNQPQRQFNQQRQQFNQNNQQPNFGNTCFGCGATNHFIKDCPFKEGNGPPPMRRFNNPNFNQRNGYNSNFRNNNFRGNNNFNRNNPNQFGQAFRNFQPTPTPTSYKNLPWDMPYRNDARFNGPRQNFPPRPVDRNNVYNSRNQDMYFNHEDQTQNYNPNSLPSGTTTAMRTQRKIGDIDVST